MQKQALSMAISFIIFGLAEVQAETNQAIEFSKVVVTATRLDEDINEVNRAISVIGRENIELIQPQSIPQAVASEPNIVIVGGPRANSQSINIRGLTGSKILQTVDGSVQTFESGHRPTYFLDPELLQAIEVIRGPASSLWGSGAIGGVVAQNTLDPHQLLESDQRLGGFIKTSYNNNNHAWTTTLAAAARTDVVDWLFSTYYRDTNDIELGNGSHLVGSAERDRGMMLKSIWQLNDAQSLAFNFRHAEFDGAVPTNGSAFINSSNFLIQRSTSTNNFMVDYELDPISELVDLNLKIYWNDINIAESRLSDGRSDDTEVDLYGINLNNRSEFSGVKLLYGIDGYIETFEAVRRGSDRPIPPDAESRTLGGFVQASIPLIDTLSLEVGARYDTFETEANNLHIARDDDAFSPSVALIWEPTKWLGLTLRYDRAFRAPGVEELYSSGTHFCMGPNFCNTFLPNPDLKAEKAANVEFLAKLTFQDIFGDDILRINASIAQNRVDDFIEQIVTPPKFFPKMDPGYTTWLNVDKARINSFEVAVDYEIKNFQTKLSYGQSRGKDRKTREDLIGIPADTWKFDASYRFFGKQLTTGIRLTYADDQNHTPASDSNDYDSYFLTDLYASFEPKFANFENVKIDLAVNNITDRHYRIAWEQLHQPGREVVLSMRYKF